MKPQLGPAALAWLGSNRPQFFVQNFTQGLGGERGGFRG